MGKRAYRSHGVRGAKAALREWGNRSIERALDGRSATAKALVEWKQGLADDLGGDPSVAQWAIIDMAARDKFLLDGLDAWLMSQDRLPVDKRARKVWQVVRDRQTLSNGLMQKLTTLGLERRKSPPQDLTAYIEQRYTDEEADAGDGG